jgi:hypothetical protein
LWQSDTERFDSFEVQDQLNFYGLLDWQVTRACSFAYSPNCQQRDQRERHRNEAEIQPGVGAARVFRDLKELVDQPSGNAEP